ncbi:glutamate-5-semialdehyde dehydrogenase [Granulicella mallensis]|uniref:Gamma-glutamyl phosphate reductase n=1 Tax=Granulicella mallensis (strain ATCC BAA-1857 / DSM 23137 / MP5ACTX8) TaxID=682795 RepID=G8NU97_GRAMM|nr:glutamate-5-semialdehyde dehydrogenase [Granulicella mallensis]AEU38732.1 gamma-glutamyl phosphate reductase [Granulicella mallensis MP5ACTX8]
MSEASESSVRATAEAAKQASRTLAPLDEPRRNAALEAMAQALEAAGAELFAANAEDLKIAESMSGDEKLSPATLSRLKLNETKLREMVEQVRSVAALPDPLGRTLDAIELDDRNPGDVAGTQGLHLQKLSVPLGVLAVIFEARPDAVTQISALALKSGNAVILKPGREVERTASALVRVLREAIVRQGLPADAISLVLGRERVNELLGMHGLVDMVIPRGSKALVEYVQANTRIPVLGHAEGVCHIYVDRCVDEALALRVISDAKIDYPAACNAVETVLVHRDIAKDFLPKLAAHLGQRGVALHGDEATRKLLGAGAPVEDWHTEYGELALSIGVVDSLEQAIDHIHTHGSSHTESILTEDDATAERFLREVDAAGVFHNASTRFADGFRYGFGAEVGISTSKFHARGPVGLDGLTTYKYVLRGQGHVAGDYRGANARAFTHRRANDQGGQKS